MEHGIPDSPMRRTNLNRYIVRIQHRGGCCGMQGADVVGEPVRIPDTEGNSPVMPVHLGGEAVFLTLAQLAELPSRSD
jgi:hypothetical protein